MIAKVIQLNVITVKKENVINPKLFVGWDVKKAEGEIYSCSLVLFRCQRKKNEIDVCNN